MTMVVLKVWLPSTDCGVRSLTKAGDLKLQDKSSLIAEWGGRKVERLGPKHRVVVS